MIILIHGIVVLRLCPGLLTLIPLMIILRIVSQVNRRLYRWRNHLHPFQSLFYQLPYLLDILSVLEHLHALIVQVDCLTVEEAMLSDENEVEDDTRGRDEKFNKVEVVESTVLLFFA